MQNYTDNANEDVPLTVESACIFSFFDFKLRTCSSGKKNKIDQSFSLWEIFSFYDDNVNQLR